MPDLPIGDPRPAGQAGPAGDQRPAGDPGPAGDPRPTNDTPPTVQFDPTDHTVDEVKAHLETVDDDERKRILDAEANGKARASLAD